MAKLSIRELERELEKAGEIPCDAELEVELTLHEQAVENIRDYIYLDHDDPFGDVCNVHGRLKIEMPCSECRKAMSLALDQLVSIGVNYTLDPAIFNYETYELLVDMHHWFARNGKAFREQEENNWPDMPVVQLHPNDRTDEHNAARALRKILKEKGLVMKFDGVKCANKAYELIQILDAWLEYRNNHELEMMSNANAA